MFRKIVAIEDTLLNNDAVAKLHECAGQVQMYFEAPADDDEIIRRIGDADAVLVSFKTKISRNVIENCPNIRYIGMCCTLYSEKSCNVDITAAREKGITVLGVRDYGDEGVVEYVVSELVRFLHGFGESKWKSESQELTGQKVGIIGLGKTGRMVADALRFLGSEVSYFSRSRKSDAEESGITYRPLHGLLEHCDIVICCLPRDLCLLSGEEFRIMGNGKILMNTSIGPVFDVPALKDWLAGNKDSRYFCDACGMGTFATELTPFSNVIFTPVVAGYTMQSIDRLSVKALDNICSFLGETTKK